MTLSLSWKTLQHLEQEYGDAFFVVDLNEFERNFFEFRDAFRNIYPRSQIAYSYKTNYMPRLCQLVNAWGGYAEVVSRMEYDLARKIGVPLDRIVFNGPYKTADDIATALQGRSLLNLDSPYQIDILQSLLRESGRLRPPVQIGLRVHFDVDGQTSRFGFDADGRELTDVFRRLQALEEVEVVGLHCHFATRTRSIEVYASIARRLLELSAACFVKVPPKFLDLGGGYYSKMSDQLKAQFSSPPPSYQEYAEVIAGRFRTAFPDDGPELILEPGVAITANIAYFFTKVLDVRKFGDHQFVLVSGSIHNIKPTLNKFNLPCEVIHAPYNGASLSGTMSIVGYTCMEHDLLFQDFQGTVTVGDYVRFENVGAYTNVMKQPFIRPSPPMLGKRDNTDGFELLKRQETLDDIFASYRF